jgi:succinoglycan biosynthesis protein ExoM
MSGDKQLEYTSGMITQSSSTTAEVQPARVAVCIATCQRPAGLRALLESLAQLKFQKCRPPALRIIVVDNDPDGSAAQTCRAAGSFLSWRLNYSREDRRGISQARNRAVMCAGEALDFLAFIDDDEFAEPFWLDELLDAQQRYGADVVCGPVVSRFSEPVPDWVVRGRFFERTRRPSGSLLKLFNTGNVLIGAQVLARFSPPFDERFSLVGGEDTHLARRVERAGFKMIWADTAVVYELVPKSRATTNWILRRAYRLGNSYSLSVVDLDRSPLPWLERLLKGTIRILVGMLIFPFAFLGGKSAVVRSLQMISRGAGTIGGLIGLKYLEYSNCSW